MATFETERVRLMERTRDVVKLVKISRQKPVHNGDNGEQRLHASACQMLVFVLLICSFLSKNRGKNIVFMIFVVHLLLCDVAGVEGAQLKPVSWRWLSGSSQPSHSGACGAAGQFSTSYYPGGRYAVLMTPSYNGVLYMYGGSGFCVSGSMNVIGEVWAYRQTSWSQKGEWGWLGGLTNSVSYAGVYSGSVYAGAREGSVGWLDGSSLVILGGYGYDHAGTFGKLSDCWTFDVTSYAWSWLKGPSVVNQAASFGTKGMAASGNTPGGLGYAMRLSSTMLYGGQGYITETEGALADTWSYDKAQNMWTWLHGPSQINKNSVGGTSGDYQDSYYPGGRLKFAVMSASSIVYIYGGQGYSSSNSALDPLADLWAYDIGSNQWAFIAGESSAVGDSALSSYDTLSTFASASHPGSRLHYPVGWTDPHSGLILLHGGYGYGSTTVMGRLSDLWAFNATDKLWAWAGGSSVVNQYGDYGDSVWFSTTNRPGGRNEHASSTDESLGLLYLFGGFGYSSSGYNNDKLNDLWVDLPNTASLHFKWNDAPCAAPFGCPESSSNPPEYYCRPACKKVAANSTIPMFCPTGWSQFQGDCFLIPNVRRTWYNARQDCINRGGHLASIHSSAENQFVWNLCMASPWSGGYGPWIGLNNLADSNVWAWEDGTPFDYVDWNTGDPNLLTSERCVMFLYRFRPLKWANWVCDGGENYYVCKVGLSGVQPTPTPSSTPTPLTKHVMAFGGAFSAVGGHASVGLALWDIDTSSWVQNPKWNLCGTLSDTITVKSIRASGADATSSIYVGGKFTCIGGVSANNIAMWKNGQWFAMGSGVSGDRYTEIEDIVVSGTDVIVGGSFSTAGGITVNNIARWDTIGGTWNAMGSGFEVKVYALAIFQGIIYAGGDTLGRFADDSPKNLALWNATALSWTFFGHPNYFVLALHVDGGVLFIGGVFTMIGSVTAERIVKWDGERFTAFEKGLNDPISYIPSVYAIVVNEMQLIAGGMLGGLNYIARWNGTDWLDIGGGVSGCINPQPRIYAIDAIGGQLYVGGTFLDAGKKHAPCVAKWDGTSWHSLGVGIPSVVTEVRAIHRSILEPLVPFPTHTPSLPTTPITSPVQCPLGWSVFNGYCYRFLGCSYCKWNSAQQGCSALSSNLASIHSEEESAFVFNLVPSSTSTFWIGGKALAYSAQWSWVDGSPMDYYPALVGRSSCDLGVRGWTSGHLLSSSCTSNPGNGYICKSNPNPSPTPTPLTGTTIHNIGGDATPTSAPGLGTVPAEEIALPTAGAFILLAAGLVVLYLYKRKKKESKESMELELGPTRVPSSPTTPSIHFLHDDIPAMTPSTSISAVIVEPSTLVTVTAPGGRSHDFHVEDPADVIRRYWGVPGLGNLRDPSGRVTEAVPSIGPCVFEIDEMLFSRAPVIEVAELALPESDIPVYAPPEAEEKQEEIARPRGMTTYPDWSAIAAPQAEEHTEQEETTRSRGMTTYPAWSTIAAPQGGPENL